MESPSEEIFNDKGKDVPTKCDTNNKYFKLRKRNIFDVTNQVFWRDIKL